jgi:hypothetical protein
MEFANVQQFLKHGPKSEESKRRKYFWRLLTFNLGLKSFLQTSLDKENNLYIIKEDKSYPLGTEG